MPGIYPLEEEDKVHEEGEVQGADLGEGQQGHVHRNSYRGDRPDKEDYSSIFKLTRSVVPVPGCDALA